MMLPTYSQTNSKTSSDSCIVAVSTLRNALIIKSQRDLLKKEIEITRDSISKLTELIDVKDSIIKNQEEIILLYKQNLERCQEVVKTKDSIIEEWKKKYKKQRNLKLAGFGTGILGIFIAIIK